MAAYRQVDDLMVTCRPTACTPGSAPGPTLGIEYGKPLLFLYKSSAVFSEAAQNYDIVYKMKNI